MVSFFIIAAKLQSSVIECNLVWLSLIKIYPALSRFIQHYQVWSSLIKFDQVQMSWIELDWVGSSYIELKRVELSWIEMDWVGLSWIELDQVGSSWIKLNQFIEPKHYRTLLKRLWLGGNNTTLLLFSRFSSHLGGQCATQNKSFWLNLPPNDPNLFWWLLTKWHPHQPKIHCKLLVVKDKLFFL